MVIERAKAKGDDLSEYRQKMGQAVSDAIMSNLEERKRRAAQMAKNNQTPDARQRSRETAIKTSARPEIIAARTLRLQNSYKPSKGERVVQQLLEPHGFKRNCLISDPSFHKGAHRRQVDFINHKRKILIEFDGQHHFTVSWKRINLADIQSNDVNLDRWAIRNSYVLIRIGWKNFNARKNQLNDWAKTAILDLLARKDLRGVWLLGSEYKNHPSSLEQNVNTYDK